MQLTGTNRSIGLIALIFSVHDFVVIAGLDPAIHRNKTFAIADRGPRVKPEDCAQTVRVFACFVSLCFAGLVVLARSMNPIPSRTRPLNSSAPMVLWLKPWESRSLPGLPSTRNSSLRVTNTKRRLLPEAAFLFGSADQLKARVKARHARCWRNSAKYARFRRRSASLRTNAGNVLCDPTGRRLSHASLHRAFADTLRTGRCDRCRACSRPGRAEAGNAPRRRQHRQWFGM